MKVKYNKTIFSNGMMGKSTYGRTDSDYYKGSVKRVVDGIIYPQGGIKNITLDEDLKFSTRQYSRLFEIKKGKFNFLIQGSKYMIGQRMFSNTIDLIRVDLDGGGILDIQYIDSVGFGADLKEYLVQIDNKLICSTNGSSTERSETFFSGTLQKYKDSDVANDIIEDSATFEIGIVTDIEVSNLEVVGVIGADSIDIVSIDNPSIGVYNLVVRANECDIRALDLREVEVAIDIGVGVTPSNTYEVVQEVDGSIYVGILSLASSSETVLEPVLINEDSEEEIFEDTPTYRIFSQAFQRKGVLPDGSIGTLLRYRVYQSDKTTVAVYVGRVQSSTSRVAVAFQGTIALPTQEIFPQLVLEIEEENGELKFKDDSPKSLSEVITFQPVNPNFFLIDQLLDDLGYVGNRYYAWKYDPINDYFELFITSDSGYANEIEIGGIKITQRNEMKETRIFGGSGRKIDGDNKTYKILAVPRVDTYNFTTTTADIESIIPESLYCYSLLDVDFCGLSGKFDNRLVLTQFTEGSSIIAFSRLSNFFDFTFDGTTFSDGYITQFKDDIDLVINRIIEHKTMVLFTSKGIYTSSLLDSQFNPTSFAFKRIHTIVPNTSFPPEFLNGDMIFLDSKGSKLYALIELKESARYSITDLTLFANDIFSDGITVTTIDLAQEVGSEFVLVSSFTNDGLVNYNSDNDILSWTTLSTEGIYTKIFTEGSDVYVYDLYSFSITPTKPKFSVATIELLEPEIEFGGGDKLSFHDYYKFENAMVKIYGKFDTLDINESGNQQWEGQPYSRDDNYVVTFDLNYKDEKDIIVTVGGDSEVIFQSMALTIDVSGK